MSDMLRRIKNTLLNLILIFISWSILAFIAFISHDNIESIKPFLFIFRCSLELALILSLRKIIYFYAKGYIVRNNDIKRLQMMLCTIFICYEVLLCL